MSSRDILDVISSEFGYNITLFEEFDIGVNFSSYHIVCEDGREVFAKGVVDGSEESISRLKREVAVLSSLGEAGVQFVPTVYESYFSCDCSVIVCEFVSGQYFSRDVMSSSYFARSIGRYLSEVHSIQPSGLPVGEYGEYGYGLVERVRDIISGTPYDEYTEVIDSCYTVLSETESVRGVPHGDFHPSNVLFDTGGRVEYVIDWEYGGVSDVLIDVAKAEVRFFELYRGVYEELGVNVDELLQGFRGAYGFSNVNLERLQVLKILFVLRELGLVWEFGELELWQRIAGERSALSSCQALLETKIGES